MNSSNPLDSIVMISIPENLQDLSQGLSLDPSILLPVEVPPGIDPSEWNMENLSWEMIISGMLKILAYNNNHEHAKYYRNFILKVKPTIVKELTQSAIVKSQTHDFELSEEIFKALIGLEPAELRHRLNLTIMYENKSNHLKSLNRTVESMEFLEIAEDSYLRLIEQGDDLPDIFFNASWFFYNKQDFTKSSELAEAYIHIGKDDVKVAEAKKLLNESDLIKSQNSEYKEAYDLILHDDNTSGIKKIETFLLNNPKVWNAWFLKGWGLRKMGYFKDALLSFQEAAKLKPEQIDILNEIAICQMEMESYTDAAESLRLAYELDSENIKVISNMGILSLKQDKKDEATAFFKTVLELEPEDPIALEYLNFLKNSADNA